MAEDEPATMIGVVPEARSNHEVAANGVRRSLNASSDRSDGQSEGTAQKHVSVHSNSHSYTNGTDAFREQRSSLKSVTFDGSEREKELPEDLARQDEVEEHLREHSHQAADDAQMDQATAQAQYIGSAGRLSTESMKFRSRSVVEIGMVSSAKAAHMACLQNLDSSYCGISFDVRAEMSRRMESTALSRLSFDKPQDLETTPSGRIMRGRLIKITPFAWKTMISYASFAGFVEGEAVRWILLVLALLSVVIAPAMISLEASCDYGVERQFMFGWKLVHFIGSVIYTMLVLAGFWIRHARSLSRFIRRMRYGKPSRQNLIERRSAGGGSVRRTAITSNLDVRSWKAVKPDLIGVNREHGTFLSSAWTSESRRVGEFFDLVALVGLLPEMLHLIDEPSYVPPPMLLLWSFNLPKVWRWITMTSVDSGITGYMYRLASIFLSLFLFIHVSACGFALLGTLEVYHERSTFLEPGLLPSDGERSCLDIYVRSLYFTSYTVTSIGLGDMYPTNNVERSFYVVLGVCSQLYLAKVFADLNFITTTHNHFQVETYKRAAQTSAALDSIGAPKALRHRVRAYQRFVWDVHKERRGMECLRDLSGPLSEELLLVRYYKLVTQVPFLEHLSHGALRYILSAIEDQVFLPADFIMRRGDSGSSIYLVREGYASIFITRNAPVWTDQELRTVGHGTYFGELALMTGQPRSAWVMARSFCVCSLLSKAAVDEVMIMEPACVVPLVGKLKDLLKVTPKTTWNAVAARLRNEFGDEEALIDFVCLDPAEKNRHDASLTWAQYQRLMTYIGVSPMDLRLLWLEMKHNAVGNVDFDDFGEILHNSGFYNEEEKEALAEAAERETLFDGTGSVCPSGSPSLPAVAVHVVASSAHLGDDDDKPPSPAISMRSQKLGKLRRGLGTSVLPNGCSSMASSGMNSMMSMTSINSLANRQRWCSSLMPHSPGHSNRSSRAQSRSESPRGSYKSEDANNEDEIPEGSSTFKTPKLVRQESKMWEKRIDMLETEMHNRMDGLETRIDRMAAHLHQVLSRVTVAEPADPPQRHIDRFPSGSSRKSFRRGFSRTSTDHLA